MKTFCVTDIMVTDVVTLDADEDLDVADKVMELARIRHLPVVEGERLVGLVTHRDLLAAQVSSLAALPADEEQALRASITAGAIMRTEVNTVTPSTPVIEAARMMRDHKYGCLPVVDEGRLVGIVTEADFLDLVIRALEDGGYNGVGTA